MFYKNLEIKDLLNKKDGGKQVIDLLDSGESHLKLIYMEKNESFNSLVQRVNVCIYMLEGEITLTFNEKAACSCNECFCNEPHESDDKKYTVKKNEFFMFKKDITHSAEAVKDSIFLIVKI